MTAAENYLFGGEEVALVVRRHPVVLAKPALAPLAAVVLCAAVPNRFTFVVLGLVLCRFSWELGLWWLDRYVLTTNRILSTSGIITTAVVSMPLAKITDLTYTRSLWGRILGYGKVHLESAGQVGLESIDYLPDPNHFYRSVMSLALGPPSSAVAHGATSPEDVVDLDAQEDPRTSEIPAIRRSDD